MSDFEKSINASDLIDWIMCVFPDWCVGGVREIVDHIEEMPSAQPKPDEWCTDCKEYDPEKHCCPRFNRVIRNALKDTQPEQKKGKWEESDDGWDGVYYVCSECGCPWILIDGTPYDNGMNYCPNCGAKMEVEE